jgi:ParB family chromosome partitioning protein
MMKDQQKRLGRGLAALLGETAAPSTVNAPGVQRVPVEMMGPSPFQPRRDMDETALNELADSIRQHGILQPLLVRPSPGVAGAYQIIAGERRWRAAQKVPLHEVPVLVREFSDQDALAIGLVENLQREDLNPVEEALGFKRLMVDFKLTQESLAEAVGKSRGHVSNLLRLLKLPEPVLALMRDGSLSVGHGKALLTAVDPAKAAKEVLARQLSVRQTEEMLDAASRAPKPAAAAKAEAIRDADAVALEESLSERLGLKVRVNFNGKGGSIVMNYASLDQLDSLLALLNG